MPKRNGKRDNGTAVISEIIFPNTNTSKAPLPLLSSSSGAVKSNNSSGTSSRSGSKNTDATTSGKGY